MELKEGMLIRTKYGIAKIKEIEIKEDNEDTCYYLDKEILLSDEYLSRCLYNYEYYLEQIIGEPSYNPIDLIEVGDILSFKDGSICRIMEIVDNYYLLKDYGGQQYYERKEWIEDCESIATKEQFERMEYKL